MPSVRAAIDQHAEVRGRPQDWQLAVGTALASWCVLAFTAPHLPIVWDEGVYLSRADQIASWFASLFDPGQHLGGVNAFSAEAIREHWPFITFSEGHPAWFAIPVALTKALLGGVLHPLTAARLGPITVFSVAAGGVALRLKKDYGTTAALVAPIALLTLPRLFSDAHFATQDAQLTAWWLLLWAADSSQQRRPHTPWIVGVLLGLTCATKFTGWAAWIPVLMSRAVSRDRERTRELLVVLPVALLTFYVVNPPLWHTPITAFMTHLRLNLGRADALNIPTAFLGARYDLLHPLPWYNTLVWLAIATPLPTLMLGLIGLRRSFADPNGFTLVLHWVTPMVLRSLPSSPPHDGIRLFLPAFGFWCVFAAIGAQRVWELSSSISTRRRMLIRTAVVASFAVCAFNVTRYYPQTLSHYSLLVGGLRGASALGMEPTYWWDSLDEDVLEWLNMHTEPAAGVAFSLNSGSNLARLREWGRLQTRFTDRNGVFKWYVLQNRTGMLNDVDRALMQTAEPAYTKYVGRHTPPVPADLNVPVLLIYSADQYRQAALSVGAP